MLKMPKVNEIIEYRLMYGNDSKCGNLSEF